MIGVHLFSVVFIVVCCVANATNELLDLLRSPLCSPNRAIHLIADYDTIPSLDLQRSLEALVALLPQHVPVYVNTATDSCGPEQIIRQLRTQVVDSYANDSNLQPVIDINGLLDWRPDLLRIFISNIRVDGKRLRSPGSPAILFRTFCDSTNCLVQQSPQLHVFDVVDLGHIGVNFIKVHPMKELWRSLGQFGRKSPHNLQNFYPTIPDTVAASESPDAESDETNMLPVTLTESEAAHRSLERILQQIVMRTRHYVTIRLPHQLRLIAVKLQALMERIKQRFIVTGELFRYIGSAIASACPILHPVGAFLLQAFDGLLYVTDRIRFRPIHLHLHLWHGVVLPMYSAALRVGHRIGPTAAFILRRLPLAIIDGLIWLVIGITFLFFGILTLFLYPAISLCGLIVRFVVNPFLDFCMYIRYRLSRIGHDSFLALRRLGSFLWRVLTFLGNLITLLAIIVPWYFIGPSL